MSEERLEAFGIYKLACQLFDEVWVDSEIIGGLTATIITIESKRTK